MMVTKILFGIDEVGTGDYFGPVVSVSAGIKEDVLSELNKQFKIRDSKLLSDYYITQIVRKLKRRVFYGISVIGGQRYNKLIQQGFNLNEVKTLAHLESLFELQNKIISAKLSTSLNNCVFVLDAYCNRNNFLKYVLNLKKIASFDTLNLNNIQLCIKADSIYPAVMIASLLARSEFLREIYRISKYFAIGQVLPLGSGNNVKHFLATQIANKNWHLKKVNAGLTRRKMKYVAKIHFSLSLLWL